MEGQDIDCLMDLLDNDVLDSLIKHLDIPVQQNDMEIHENLEAPLQTSTVEESNVEQHLQQPMSQPFPEQGEFEADWSASTAFLSQQNELAGMQNFIDSTSFLEDGDVTKCPVCEDGEVGKHIYYGGKACHSCRGFFRRSVQSGHHVLFKCKNNSADTGILCLIKSKSRKSCQKCRFARCLRNAGLRPELVLSVEQRKARLIKRSNFRSLVTMESKEALSGLCQASWITHGFTSEESIMLKSQFDALMEHNHKRYMQFLSGGAAGQDLVFSFVRTIAKGMPFEKALIKTSFALDAQSTKNFAFDVPEMSDLSPADRITLISSNFRAVAGLMWVWFLSSRRAYVDHFTHHVRKNRPTAAILDLLDKNVTYHPVANFGSGPRLSDAYCMVKLEKEDDLEQMRREIIDCLATDPKRQTLDPVLSVILSLAMLFDTDSLDVGIGMLESSDKANLAWRRHLGALDKYIKSAMPNEDTREKLAKCARLTKIAKRFYDSHVEQII